MNHTRGVQRKKDPTEAILGIGVLGAGGIVWLKWGGNRSRERADETPTVPWIPDDTKASKKHVKNFAKERSARTEDALVPIASPLCVGLFKAPLLGW